MTITVIGGSGFVGTRLVKRLLASGHTVKIADKRKSAAYPELWIRCDIRNAPNETADYPESLTDAASAPGKHDEAVKAMPMHSLLDVLKGSDVVINLAAEHRDDVTPKSLYDEVNVQGSENICKACTGLELRKSSSLQVLLFMDLFRLEQTKQAKSITSTITVAQNILQRGNTLIGSKKILQTMQSSFAQLLFLASRTVAMYITFSVRLRAVISLWWAKVRTKKA